MRQITIFQRTGEERPKCVTGFRVLEGTFDKYKKAKVSEEVFNIIMTAPLSDAEEQMLKILDCKE